MNHVTVTVSLPSDLVERAREKGLLSDARMAQLLEAEVERIEQWRALNASLEPARTAFHAEHANMTEDEVIAMINDMVHEVRAEIQAGKDATSPEPSET